MIQRIQTLYLLLAAAFMSLTLFMPIATFVVDDQTYELTAFSLTCGDMSQSTIWLGTILAIATALPLITIFLFKKRTLQIRLCAVEVVLLIGSLVLVALYYWLTSRLFEGLVIEHRQFGWAAPMPIVAIVLSYLASRAIFKDEVLVRSLDRIR